MKTFWSTRLLMLKGLERPDVKSQSVRMFASSLVFSEAKESKMLLWKLSVFKNESQESEVLPHHCPRHVCAAEKIHRHQGHNCAIPPKQSLSVKFLTLQGSARSGMYMCYSYVQTLCIYPQQRWNLPLASSLGKKFHQLKIPGSCIEFYAFQNHFTCYFCLWIYRSWKVE